MRVEHTLPPTDAAGVAQARERFLTVERRRPKGVRQAILASWWRSRESKVAADRPELAYVREPELDTPLTRSAGPVLRHLHEQLDGQSVSIVLTDPAGVVLSRLTADPSLERQLDRVNLAPGFSYAESVVGTNGIGTALEAGRAMHVFGHEHYAENLEELACAGVPIRHPITGKTVGVLDLTCWRREAGPLLVTLAKATAEHIRQALLADAGAQESELLHAYLRACKHGGGMVFALNDEVVMMNALARSTLGDGDQASVLLHATEALAAAAPPSVLELPSGLQVRLHTRPVRSQGKAAGGVAEVKVVTAAPSTLPPGGIPAQRMLLPGLVGTATVWRRACTEAEAAYRTGGWLLVEGEPGTGKLALLRGLHQRVDAAGRFSVVDAGEADGPNDARWLSSARRVLAEKDGTLVLRHLDRLNDVALRVLTAAVQEVAARQGTWVAVAMTGAAQSPELARLLELCVHTVRVPPLRHHVEDVQALTPFLLQRLGTGGRLTCSAEAMQVLLRAPWPGNVEQLLGALRHVLSHHRTGTIAVTDLPPEVQALSRHRLSTLEALERDAVVLALQEAGGNKAQAARALGMARATIYRKIHEYGIIAPVAT